MHAVLILHILCVFGGLGAALIRRFSNLSLNIPVLFALAIERSDLIIEFPAFLGVLLTGGYLASHSPQTPLQALRGAAGLMAIGATIYGLLLPSDPPIAAACRFAGEKLWVRGVSSVFLIGIAIALAISLHVFVQS